MTIFTIGELIELAIGSPEPGHVNFMALQCLLHSFAEKMHIMNDKIDLTKYARYAKVILNTHGKSTRICATASNTSPEKSPKMRRSIQQMSPRTRKSISIVSRTKQSLLTSSTGESSGELTSIRSNTSDKSLPKMRRALVSIIERKYNIPSSFHERLAGGADEPPAEDATATEAENTATEERTEGEPAEEAATAETEQAPPQATPPTTEAAPTEQPTEVPQESKEAEPQIEAVEMDEGEGTTAPAADIEAYTVQAGTDTSGDTAAPLRLSRLQLPMTSLPEDLRVGIAIMKDQLDLAMEELSILTTLILNNKVDQQRIGQLRQIASRLRAIQRDNVYIEGTHRAKLDIEKSVSWIEAEGEAVEEAMLEEALGEEEELEAGQEEKTSSREGSLSAEEQERYDLGLHVCFTPDKMLELVLDLKSEFCALTNKVNEIAAQLLKHDSHRMMTQLAELQEQLRDFKLFTVMAKDMFDRLESDRANNLRNFEEMRKDIDMLKETKIDRDEVEVLLSEKVDYQQLARKVNLEQLQQLQCRMERQFCETNKLICLSERGLKAMIEELRASVGSNALEETLKKFKASIDADICCVANKLQKYIDATNDDCAAAGARFKVLQDVACVSCDTECVMRTAERNKVPKLQSAHATDTIAPLITYEMSSIRKSGIMGYMRKEEFPDSPSAWLKRQGQGQNAAMKNCLPRHAGGAHTTYTAKDRVEKILQQKKIC